MYYQFLPVNRIHYGINVVFESLRNELEKIQKKKLLIVTTKSLLNNKYFLKLIDSLHFYKYETKIIHISQHVPGNLLFKYVQEIIPFKPDIIISVGGGSPIDAGKILSFVLAEGIESEKEIYAYSENIREKRIKMENFIPNFAIPTTLSASEFTSIAGTTSSQDNIKYKFSHLNMTPSQVFLDPIFTIDTPEWLWTSTGIRAVDHAVETLYSPNPNPINTNLALQALKNLYHYLPLTKAHPYNLEFRLECQLGAWMSLFSIVNIKLGLSHSIGHQLGALYNIPHGMTSAIMLPAVMKFLLPKTYREQLQITETLGAYEKEKTLMENAEKASVLIRELIKKLDIPHKLRDFNVAKDTIPQVVENILLDIEGEENEFVLHTKNLRDEITTLLESVW